jgi:cell division protein FtsA
MRESGYEEVLSSGIVLTGGSCVMPGMVELGEDIFLKPVRRGIPSTSARCPTWWRSRAPPP